MNGLFILDKPQGITSHDVVSRLRRILGERSIGHLGTLDPMATGILPLVTGKYTRLAQFFNSAEKSYIGHIRFGFSTDTYDAEGQPTSPVTTPGLALDAILAAAARFHGPLDQMPPAYSAKKIDGKSAHELARQGKPVDLKTARVTIHEFEISEIVDDVASFKMRISAGGYVRSVAHDLGQALGCGAHLTSLRRTAAGPFTLADACTLEQLEPFAGQPEQLANFSLHPRQMLPEMPAVAADPQSLGRLRNGAQVNLPEFSSAPLVKVFSGQRDLVAICRRVAGTLFQPHVVLG